MPSARSFPWLTEYKIAHRGLFEAGTAIEENTRAAVAAAVAAGYGVEIDVQGSADNIIMVYHDTELGRLVEGSGPLSNIGFQQLRLLEIANTGETMPTLPDILEEINGQVPVFIEVKSTKQSDVQKLCAGVRHCLEGYGGPAAIMSFDPRVVSWFKSYMPKYARGLIMGREILLNWKTRLALPFIIRKSSPDFVACDINLLPNSFCQRWRKKGKPVLTWTIRNQLLEDVGKKYADALIFEKPAVLKT
ncbi:glycerophosphodiester phosphodiesterase family protein [Kordiimonas pumila]|uniref:Glycerophosphodiester phosphodiesterase family protein n=1 Tax=Kordiimonas pumila TaxID=2161677 RepID=A0ABV7D1B5_9PROT|nr:glycerophosphodiester phosphodiesterase family protein [Kordiimonas pumila]